MLLFLSSNFSFAQPAFSSVNVYVQQVGTPPNDTWQIKGAASANGIPQGITTVRFEFKFEQKDKKNWDYITTVNTYGAPNNGTLSMDTGFFALPEAARANRQYRVLVKGYYTDPNTNIEYEIAGIGSIPIIPIP